MNWDLIIAEYNSGLEILAAILALVIFVSSLDDLFIDLWYWARTAYRKFKVERGPRYSRLTAEVLRDREEQPLAIMVPAWRESDVIAAMVQNMVEVLEYRQYRVFIGTYPNDQPTIDEVEKMVKRYPQIQRVEVPHPGPTSKADCLNFVVEAIFLHERETGTEFAGIVLHDSEDVLHPLELKFFNHLLPRKDMIQLPVASLERGLGELVAGTYMDEFAESHGKEMAVRESMAGMVPSAGVGTCFSRRALQALVGATRNHPFNIESLTEDYDVGMRLQAMGMASIFGIFPVTYRVRRKGPDGVEREAEVRSPLCVREFFPDRYETAYRQKSRWVLGIGLQSWRQIPWRGRSLAARYFLLHDRKGVVTSFISIAAYALVLGFVALHAGAAAGLWRIEPVLFAPGSAWTLLLYVNAGFLAVRCFHRVYFTTQLYGWAHGLLSLPRMVVGNFVNCMAVARAWRLYLAHVVLGRRLVWDKTAHEFPTGSQLARKRQKLGELLQAWQAVDAVQVQQALHEQQDAGTPLGRVLLSHGWVDEETLAEAIAYQADLQRAVLTPEIACRHASGFPTELAVRLQAVFLGPNAKGQPVLAVAAPLDADGLAEVERVLGTVPLQRVAPDSDLQAALWAIRGGAGPREEPEPVVPEPRTLAAGKA
ncbi:MAG TPA: glycosyl transferase family protein [Ramlibacter sp.]|nr:glycosyl transferase family protein [Ramlibacter sp.]